MLCPRHFQKPQANSFRALLVAPTIVDGKQTWEHASESKNNLEVMLRCCHAELETMKRAKVVAAPFNFERAAILLRKNKQYE